ncbi:MAG TPA: hypothetical protein VK206_27415 [Anaerolineales bacterium]|nr:hypothetical protein [Anaerolineales bacterium]HLO28721.1 hypothetical protein [Anaerolineales bacterium]
MDIDSLNKRFRIWQHILFINIGASIALLATGVADLPNISSPYFPGWYGVWFVVQLASFLPGFVLLFGKHWVQLPLRERLTTIFGYFAVAWITWLPAAIRAGTPSLYIIRLFLSGCVIIAIGYRWLRRKSVETPSEMFP